MSDQDYLSLIRETEAKAAAMISEAQAQAREMLEAARIEAGRLLAEAREKADELVSESLRNATEQAEIHTDEQAVAAAVQSEQLRIEAQQSFPEAVRAVAERIVK
ncbi:MAG: hypothetical protein ACOX1T_06500 [Saccharofermentanales bacterium]|jgi:vacuolar-type H+-ATPase subunit H